MEILPGQIATYETRRESNEKVDKKKKYEQIIYILSRFDKLTAREVANQMFKLGYTKSNHRDEAAPRLTELCRMGIVEPLDETKYDEETNRNVTLYRLIIEPKQMEMRDFI